MHFSKVFIILLVFVLSSCQWESTNEALDTALEKALKAEEKKEVQQAYFHFNAALEHNQAINHRKRVIYCLLKLADLEHQTSSYHTCENTLTTAISLFQKNTPLEYQTNAYGLLGLNYAHLGNYQDAIAAYQKVKEITDDPIILALNQNNIAYLNGEIGNYEKATSLLSEIERSKVLDSTSLSWASVLHNKGYYLFRSGDMRNSLPYLLQALRIREPHQDPSELVSSYLHLAAYYAKDDIGSSKNWATKAWTAAKQAKIADDQIDALQMLIETAQNLEEKNNYYELHKQLSDSIWKARQQDKNAFAKIKYDASKTIEKNEQQKTWIYFLLFCLFLLIVIGLLIFYLFQNKAKTKLLETAYETETRISKQLHDELANDVYNTLITIENQPRLDLIDRKTLLQNLETIYERTRNISKENSSIATNEHYFDQLKHMLTAYSSATTHVILNIELLNQIKLSKEIKISLYRSLQELLVNMKKHSGATLVVISFKQENDHYVLSYSDNGVGLQNQNNFKNGLQNVENRIQAIDGNIIFDSESGKGFKVKILIPIHYV